MTARQKFYGIRHLKVGREIVKIKFLLIACLFIIPSGCAETNIAVNTEANPVPISEENANKDPDQPDSIMETVEFDTLCFNGRLVVDMYLNVEFVNGCTTDKDKIKSVMSIIDNLPNKEPSQEEDGERMTAIQQTDNYLIYLGNSVAFDKREYTITLYEDGIFQYLPIGMEGLGNITTEPYVEKYNEVKRLLDEMAE